MMSAKEMGQVVAMAYINGDDEQRNAILSVFDENEKEIFLNGVGAIRLMNDQKYYDAVQGEMAMQVWNEANAARILA